jgi:hypothetical protein
VHAADHRGLHGALQVVIVKHDERIAAAKLEQVEALTTAHAAQAFDALVRLFQGKSNGLLATSRYCLSYSSTQARKGGPSGRDSISMNSRSVAVSYARSS